MILTEYRIGNLILNKVNTICEISQLCRLSTDIGISISCDPLGQSYEVVNPIRITVTLLNSFGFNPKYNSEYERTFYHKDDFILTEDFRLCVNNKGLNIISKGKIYIHELQNLYFEITNNELEFDLNEVKQVVKNSSK